MISVLTVCGNGIGSSLMLNYINKKKITEDILDALKQAAQ